jgi:hypothetical protein
MTASKLKSPYRCNVYNTFKVMVWRKGEWKDFELSASENGKVWIHTHDGEGGEFDGGLLYDAIDKFYKENF